MYFIPFSESISKDVELMLFDFTAGIEYKKYIMTDLEIFQFAKMAILNF